MPLILLLMATTLILSSCAPTEPTATQAPLRILLGSYSPADQEGIQLYSFDPNSGHAQRLCGLKGIANPSFLCPIPSTSPQLPSTSPQLPSTSPQLPSTSPQLILSVSETDDGRDALYLFEVATQADSISMQVLSSQPTLGKAPCYVNYHPATSQAFTANYNGGSLSTFSIDLEGKQIAGLPTVTRYRGQGPFLPNQQQSHIHCAQFSPDSTLLYLCDLGSDRIHVLPLNSPQLPSTNPQLPLNSPQLPSTNSQLIPGSGPRHLIFSADGRFAYLINELSGYVTVLAHQAGTLTPIQYAQCDSVGGHGSADIHLSPDGRHLYASNRLKADGISIFSVDSISGRVEKVGYQPTGLHPRNFAISPNGRYLLCACRDSNEVQIYAIDPTTGLLSPTPHSIQMSQPVFVTFL